ncbi:MAG: hypothetical protein KGH94_01835 [Candidatus Micrarchaeota archaeon]|nr:hypothetical protein [Candidatus Micrarchaeota archaeon]
MRIAYFGKPASNTHTAALSYFGAECAMVPFRYHNEIFSAVKSGFDRGILPIYSSSKGLIAQTADLVFNTPGVWIVGEHIEKIEHLLLGVKGTRPEEVRKVITIPDAADQCSIKLQGMKVDVEEAPSTSAAAERVRNEGRRDQAAIANGSAATMYGLEVISPQGSGREWIANNVLNYTRFLIISKEQLRNPESNKTTVTFVLHQGPGELYKALNSFRRYKIDLLRIDSRPLQDPRKPEDVWKNYFYVDCAIDPNDGRNMHSALHMLRSSAATVRDHGPYVRAKMPRL